jgi:ATP-binding cassette subfamily B protein/subfamily B ATP-binding cassette protein MsbA
MIPCATAVLLFWGGNRILSDMALVKAGKLAATQALTVGTLVMFMSYLVALLSPIALLAGSATALQNSLSGLDRVLDLLAEPVEMPSKPDAIIAQRDAVQGRITLRNVSFTYQNTTAPVLHDINLDVMPGEMIALVGPSGAGKTTLCNLIARFYDPTQGSILLDGADLRDMTVDSYRRLLGIVEQDTFLFDGTIAQNISYGRRGATRDEIIHAAKLASAHEFIAKLPDGYDSLIGERGVKLSGGQRQRLTIARAILADPRILILDEATSNLDTESERLIQASLQTLMANRTSFVIAHRLSTIAHATRIVVLENGRIIEQGRHEELMRASGRYREMVELQTGPAQALEQKLKEAQKVRPPELVRE